MPNDQIQKVHASHTQDSVRKILGQFHYFKEGNCIVHHSFDGSVVDTINQIYPNDFVTAHLEVPGEFFNLAIEK